MKPNIFRPHEGRLRGLMAALAAAFMLATSGVAQAITPANTTINNTASLSYTGLATPITASVDVKVRLVASAPTLSVPADITVTDGSNAQVNYTITATANGPDTYNLSGTNALTNVTGTAAPTYTTPGGAAITSVTLGATALSANAAAGATSITVPADGANDGQINGIAPGDTVTIGGAAYTVQAIVDNAAGTSTITLNQGLLGAINAGALVAEQQGFRMNLNPAGATTTPGTPAFVDVTTTATSVANAAQASSDVVRVNLSSVNMVKYVRNVTAPNGAAAQAVLINGVTFYKAPSGVTASPNDILEYYLQASVPAGGTAINGAKITDDPPAFTTYVANSTTLNGNPVADVAGQSPLASANGGLSVNSPGQAAGTIAAGASASVTFRVTVQ